MTNKPQTNPRGSILIWTVSIGMALMTAFFFLATRLGLSRDTQRDNMKFSSAKAYTESYAAYLEARPAEMTIDFDGISGKMEQAQMILGVLDSGQEVTYDFTGVTVGDVAVRWNACNEDGDILINGTFYPDANGSCTGDEFENRQDITAPGSLELLAPNAPFHYELSRVDPAKAKFPQAPWTIDAKMPLGYGKTVNIKKTVEILP